MVRVTAADIVAEHEAALASYTLAQRAAHKRYQRVSQLSTFNYKTHAESLLIVCQREADDRNAKADAEAAAAAEAEACLRNAA